MNKLFFLLFLSLCLFVSCTDSSEKTFYKKDIVVDVAFSIEKINPLSSDTDTNKLLGNVFSTLVRFNDIMRIESDLAISWGNIDDYTWEFKIRDNVYFHDGTKLTMDDIVSTLTFVKDSNFLSTYNYANNIDSIDYKGNILTIKTKTKDPLLLQKLSYIFIVKKDDLKNKDVRLGSGKYKIVSLDNNQLLLNSFNKYYGNIAKYDSITINFVEDKNKRFQRIISSGVDLLADVPFDFINEIEEKKYLNIIETFSLDTMFLVFNIKDTGQNFLVNKGIRKLLCDIIDKNMIVELGGERYANSINQFLNSNVLGFDPSLEKIENKILSNDAAKSEIKNIFGRDDITIYLNILSTKSLSIIAQNIQQQLFKYDINADVKILSPEELEKDLMKGNGHIYVIGWRFDLLDPVDFFEKVLQYAKLPDNSDFFSILNEIKNTMDVDKRILLIKDFSKKITIHEYIGMPLIETKNIYVKLKSFNWQPRSDGALLF